ncbi:MAG: hypothetical protein GWP03_02095 [Proteobacteria bacterium]|nr:hypothetical protein [Pseudomonadota bacterium]
MKKTIFVSILLLPVFLNAYVFDLGIQLNNTTNFANVQRVTNSRATGFGFGSGFFSLFPVNDNFDAGISIQYSGYNYNFSDNITANTTVYYQLHLSNLTTELLATYSLPQYESFIPVFQASVMMNYGIIGKYFSNISGGRTTTITSLTKNDLNTDILLDAGFSMKYKTKYYDKTIYVSPALNLIYNLTGSGSHIGYINLNYSPNLTVMINLKVSIPIQIANQ